MAKPYKIPDFKKLYPETKDEIIAVLKISERKMQYQEYDLKNEQIVIDMEKQTVTVIPSREDSYERMKEADVQFRDEGPDRRNRPSSAWRSSSCTGRSSACRRMTDI